MKNTGKFVQIIGIIIAPIALFCCSTNNYDSISIYTLIANNALLAHSNELEINKYANNVSANKFIVDQAIKMSILDDEDIRNIFIEFNKIEVENYIINIKNKRIIINDTKNYWLSQIAFNKNKTIAIIFENDNIIPRAGHGIFYVLIKENEKWKIVGQIFKWTS